MRIKESIFTADMKDITGFPHIHKANSNKYSFKR
jgi:hypothetical protein